MPQFSIFIPVYNEQAILVGNTHRLITFLDGLGLSYEIIIGSNGSTDRTEELGWELAADVPQVRFFHLPMKGPGYAFARALSLFKGRSLITLDMDMAVELEFVPQALELLTRYQVVVGSKRQGRQERSATRILGSGMFITAARVLLGLPFEDYSLGAKAFSREVLTRYADAVDTHTSYTTNLMFCARRARLPMVEVAVLCSDRRASRFNLGHEAAYRLAWVMKLFVLGRLLKRFP
ncbi:MAG: glycosyltransferase family 2 protein [Desulfarculus sp.]|nr:glycosyltransferase family 2 protein [Pseudomonadota bacterium]MBU4596567.1 glycosyltransferase family 2 protein [Pseudomonadota bacterium]MBV1716534.1 glycosyltransferase family 2 protein [Desulfarculus sp.]MBV1737182.1 glycosyltransferase family 2 protein [Desulfarculus sp.]MBV1753739.1 glycosyltransferase family 2 protein [Desulfarculus sp.]